MKLRKESIYILSAFFCLLFLAVNGCESHAGIIRSFEMVLVVLSLAAFAGGLMTGRRDAVYTAVFDEKPGPFSFLPELFYLLGCCTPLLLLIRLIDPFFYPLYGYEYGHLFTIIERVLVDLSFLVLLILSVNRFTPKIGTGFHHFFDKWHRLWDLLFYICLSYACLNRGLNSTMFRDLFPNDALPAKFFRLSVTLLLLVAVITAGMQKTHGRWVMLSLIIVLGFCHYKFGGQRHLILVMCILIAAAAGRSGKKILRISVCTSGLVIALTILAMNQGYLLNLIQYSAEHPDIPRYALGFISPTDCAAHMLYLLITWCILHADCSKSVQNLDFFVMAFFFMIAFSINHARTNSLLIVLVMGLTLIHRMILILRSPAPRAAKSAGSGSHLRTLPGYLLSFSFPACFLFSYLMSKTYMEGQSLFLESILSRFISLKSYSDRLLYANRALTEYPLTLFGIDITEHGNGGQLVRPADYSFIDISYIRLLLAGGILVTLLVLAAMTALAVRFAGNRQYYILLLLCLIAANSLIEHHLSEFAYNVMPLLLFALPLSQKPPSS